MKAYRNPFRTRTQEQLDQQGLLRFLRTYGADVLDYLPDELWDRPLVVRSAPGGGKTSLLRVFTSAALDAIQTRPTDFEDLYQHMLELGAIDPSRVLVLGVHIRLANRFPDLADLGVSEEVRRKLFFRLLDAQIVREVCEAVLQFAGRRFPEDLDFLRVDPSAQASPFLDRLGGTSGTDLWKKARTAQSELHHLLDSVVPIDWEGIDGHGSLYSLRAFSGGDFAVNSESLKVKPLIMFDDGQELGAEQRDALLDALTDRELDLCRWYTERFSALTPDEVVGDGEPGRAFVVLPLERATRQLAGQVRRGRKIRSHEAMLIDIANRRARVPLQEYADETEYSFHELLGDQEDSSSFDDLAGKAVPVLRQRVVALGSDRSRYETWISEAESLDGYEAAIRWRELEIVINRDIDRQQLELLDLPLSNEDLRAQSASNIREAAALFLRHEFKLPFYFGAQRLAKLGSQNVDQFLVLSGNLFEEMLALITLRRRPSLDPLSQDRIALASSEAFWRAIPQRRSYGRDIQQLLFRIGSIAQRDTYRPKASYAPGVTGTALSMRDRNRLLSPEVRERIPGAEELLRALAGAIGHNLLSADLDRSVKNDRWMVLYLNRMLCAQFSLPLGYGGFRERSLEAMAAWMVDAPPGDLSTVEAPRLFDS